MSARTLLLSLLALLASTGASAQEILGRVVEEGSGTPVATAFVVLLDLRDERRGAVLTNADGRFILRAPHPGAYRVRVDRIGYRTTRSEWFRVTAEGVEEPLEVRVPSDAIHLDPIAVEGGGRCVLRPAEGEAAHELWSEARKALEITEWVGEESRFVYHALLFRRYMTARTMVVDSEWVEVLRVDNRQPFTSDTAAGLVWNGFIQGEGADRTFYGPDAHLLLSDAFLDTHCFRPHTGDDPALLGLAFEPVDRRGRRDIEGVLWLDATTRELRFLEFGYVNPDLPVRVDRDRYGGVVHFHRMEDGAWIVSRWRIRSPVMFRNRRRAWLQGFSQTEGEVFAVRTRDGREVPWTSVGGTVTGFIMDRVDGTPIQDALVRILGTPYETLTDATGWFSLTGLPDGRYRLRIEHRDIRPSEQVVDVVRGDTVDIRYSG